MRRAERARIRSDCGLVSDRPWAHGRRRAVLPTMETLVQWYRSGQDVERRLPVLSTYLGHVHVADTYWYLSACPELMGLAVKRFEDYWEKQS